MRESSSNLVPSNSQKLNKIQGGDKKFMKKSLSLILALAMVFTMFASVAFAADAPAATPAATPPVTAATYTPQQAFDALKAAGIVEGDAVKGANLDANMTRAEFAKVIAKLWELPENAAGSTVYTDLAGASWAAGYIGAATKAGLLNGVGGNKFNPSGNVKVEEIAKVIATGFKLPAVAYAGTGKVSTWAKGFVGAVIAAKILDESADFTKAAKRSELFTVGIKGFVLYQATKLPTPTPAPAAATLDIASAVAVNSKVVEVALGTAAAAADVTVANVSVKDSAGTVVVVSSVAVAPYSTDAKTILVTLAANTVSGTYYTVTSGTKSSNFGAIAVDTTAPVVTKVESTDYNQVQITFSERVNITSLKAALALKYGLKTALAVSKTAYVANDGTKVTLDTADQSSDLFGVDISGATDFAGNTLTADTNDTFPGTLKDITTTLQPVAAPLTVAIDSKNVRLVFNTKVDPTTIAAVANYTLKEAYGTQTQIAVASVRAAVDGDFVQTELDNNAKISAKSVVITLSTSMKDSTLYKLTVSGLKTYTGVAVDGTTNSVTFGGVGPYTGAIDVSTTTISVKSNTSVQLTFVRSLDAATILAANFKIAKTYGTKDALAVSAVKIVNSKTVTLTTGSQTSDLYTLTVAGVKDIDGNTIDSSLATKTFAGSPIAPAIAAIGNASLSGNILTVKFDQNVGANATDISHYFISDGIGYPSKAIFDDATTPNAATVKLTIAGTTVPAKIYTITVKGIANSDGIVQTAASITGQFIGNGTGTAKPTAQYASAVDAQTLRVYFDRAVDDDAIDTVGTLYNSATPYSSTGSNLLSKGFVVTTKYGTVDLKDIAGTFAVKDPSNANALLIGVPATGSFVGLSGTGSNAGFFKSTNLPATNSFTLTVNPVIVVSDSSANVITVPATTVSSDAVTVNDVQALNKSTIRVYFSKSVQIANPLALAAVATVASTVYTAGVKIDHPVVVPGSNSSIWDFNVASPFVSPISTQYLVFNTPASISSADFSDITHTAGLISTQASKAFTTSLSDPGRINDINVQGTTKKTLVVYFPESVIAGTFTDAVGTASVLAKANYTLYTTSSGGTAVKNAALNDFWTTNVVDSSIDGNKVTFTLNEALPTSSTYFLEFNSALKNSLNNKNVANSDGSTLRRQFVAGSTTAALVTVSSATYASATGALTIKLNQKVSSSNAPINTAAQFVSQFAVSITKSDGSSYTLVQGDIASASVTSTIGTVVTNTTTDADTISITLNPAARALVGAGKVGTVKFTTGTNNLIGLNGEAYDSASSTVFSQ